MKKVWVLIGGSGSVIGMYVSEKAAKQAVERIAAAGYDMSRDKIEPRCVIDEYTDEEQALVLERNKNAGRTAA